MSRINSTLVAVTAMLCMIYSMLWIKDAKGSVDGPCPPSSGTQCPQQCAAFLAYGPYKSCATSSYGCCQYETRGYTCVDLSIPIMCGSAIYSTLLASGGPGGGRPGSCSGNGTCQVVPGPSPPPH
jgi:hypothetical protein